MALAYFRLTGVVRIVLILTAALLVAALGPPTQAPAGPSGRTRVILEMASPPALAEVPRAGEPGAEHRKLGWERAGRRAAVLRQDHRQLVDQVADSGIDIDVVHDMTATFNGMVVEVAASEVAELAAMPGVRAVHHDAVYQHALTESVPLVGAPEVWAQADEDGLPVTGAGLIVSVLDTGVDYTHPDLGGGFGPEFKVVAGHDFVNGDDDPMDDNGHGTHVAGIVAADGELRGVAPGAMLTAYKVLNRSGSGQVSDIIAGLDAAIHPNNPYRADVVNMSLSGPGDGADPLSIAASQAVDAGVVVVSAAGNAGPGPQTMRSPAAADGVLAVGASVSGVRVPRARMIAPAQQDLRAVRFDISGNPPDSPIQLEVVDVGQGLPGGYDDIDVAGKALLINQTRPAPELALHAEERGAAAVFLYFPDFWGFVPESSAHAAPLPPATAPSGPNSDAFSAGLDDDRLGIPLMQIPGASAATLQAYLAEGDVRVEVTGLDATDQLADFSSRGPSGIFTQKPDLLAPGVEILSTLPDGTHGRGTGTSMAAPHVAGGAALLRQLHPDWTAEQVSAALTSTAHRLDDGGPLEQGAGRLDIPAAAATELLATPSTISFGLADLSGDRITETGTLTLTNLSTEQVDVSLSVVRDDSTEASVTLNPGTLQLAPGERVDVEARVELSTPNADIDVTGWVIVDKGSGTQQVPFLLAVRQLGLHTTPDPAPANAETAVFISSPADLTAAPSVEITCPGLSLQRPEVRPFGTRIWRAAVEIADSGVCRVNATGTADERYGRPVLTGVGAFEAVATPEPGRGIDMWQSIGPNAGAGWLAFDISRSRNQMAVVPTGSPSAFVTGDLMQTWRELRTMPMAGGSPASVAVHPRDGGQLYVAVNGGSADGSYRGRIMHTDDAGTSWQILPGPDEVIDHIALDGSGQALAAVTGDDRLRVTLDDGATWTELPSLWSSVQDIHWIGADLYLATFSGLVVVRDAAGPNPADPVVLLRPGVLGWAGRVAGDTETIIVSGYPFPQLFASSDGGASFKQVLQTTGISFFDVELVGDDIYALQGSRQLWVGHGRGADWDSWGDPVPAAVEFDVGHWPWDPDTAYVASSGAGIYTANEPDEFQRVGVPGAWVFDLATAEGADGEVLVAGTVADTFRTQLPRRASIQPDDLEWESAGAEGLGGVSAEFVATSPADPSVMYKVSPDPFLTFGIYRSDDGGATWERKASPSEEPFALLVHPADPDRIYVSYASLTGEGLAVSTDGGETWRKLDQGRTFGALAGDPTDPDRIWAGESFGFGRDGLWLSEDGGLNFHRLSSTPVTAIAVDPDDPDHLVVAGREIFTSSDGGKTLMRADHVDLDLWVTDIKFAPGDNRHIFAAAGAFYDELGVLKGGRGVLTSDDSGASWQSLTTGLSNPNVTSLALDKEGRYLFAGVGGGSVHRIKLPDS